jgi:hypothetical protein
MINVKKVLVVLITILFLTQITIAQNLGKEADTIIGTWVMEDDMGVLEIFREGKCYNGKIVYMKKTEEDGTPLQDKENPVDSLKNREVVGLQVMNNFKYEGNNIWNEGTFYAALKGKEVEPDFILVNENRLNLKISFFIFSKTVELTRVDKKEYFNSMKQENN